MGTDSSGRYVGSSGGSAFNNSKPSSSSSNNKKKTTQITKKEEEKSSDRIFKTSRSLRENKLDYSRINTLTNQKDINNAYKNIYSQETEGLNRPTQKKNVSFKFSNSGINRIERELNSKPLNKTKNTISSPSLSTTQNKSETISLKNPTKKLPNKELITIKKQLKNQGITDDELKNVRVVETEDNKIIDLKTGKKLTKSQAKYYQIKKIQITSTKPNISFPNNDVGYIDTKNETIYREPTKIKVLKEEKERRLKNEEITKNLFISPTKKQKISPLEKQQLIAYEGYKQREKFYENIQERISRGNRKIVGKLTGTSQYELLGGKKSFIKDVAVSTLNLGSDVVLGAASDINKAQFFVTNPKTKSNRNKGDLKKELLQTKELSKDFFIEKDPITNKRKFTGQNLVNVVVLGAGVKGGAKKLSSEQYRKALEYKKANFEYVNRLSGEKAITNYEFGRSYLETPEKGKSRISGTPQRTTIIKEKPISTTLTDVTGIAKNKNLLKQKGFVIEDITNNKKIGSMTSQGTTKYGRRVSQTTTFNDKTFNSKISILKKGRKGILEDKVVIENSGKLPPKDFLLVEEGLVGKKSSQLSDTSKLETSKSRLSSGRIVSNKEGLYGGGYYQKKGVLRSLSIEKTPRIRSVREGMITQKNVGVFGKEPIAQDISFSPIVEGYPKLEPDVLIIDEPYSQKGVRRALLGSRSEPRITTVIKTNEVSGGKGSFNVQETRFNTGFGKKGSFYGNQEEVFGSKSNQKSRVNPVSKVFIDENILKNNRNNKSISFLQPEIKLRSKTNLYPVINNQRLNSLKNVFQQKVQNKQKFFVQQKYNPSLTIQKTPTKTKSFVDTLTKSYPVTIQKTLTKTKTSPPIIPYKTIFNETPPPVITPPRIPIVIPPILPFGFGGSDRKRKGKGKTRKTRFSRTLYGITYGGGVTKKKKGTYSGLEIRGNKQLLSVKNTNIGKALIG